MSNGDKRTVSLLLDSRVVALISCVSQADSVGLRNHTFLES